MKHAVILNIIEYLCYCKTPNAELGSIIATCSLALLVLEDLSFALRVARVLLHLGAPCRSGQQDEPRPSSPNSQLLALMILMATNKWTCYKF
jgi:hypothetical protein